jgi:predicted nucleic acid-binding protein
VTRLLDTNILMRHFTGEPPDQARRATCFLKAAAPGELVLTDLVVAELVFVLQSGYAQPHSRIAQLVRSAIALEAVSCDSEPLLYRTLELYDSGRDFTDAYLVATAERMGIPEIVTFDRGLRDVPEVRRIEP